MEVVASTLLFYTNGNFVPKGEKAVPKKVQYANLQLLVGHHAFPPKEGTSEPITAPYLSRFHPSFQDTEIFVVGSSPREYLRQNPRGTISSRDGTGDDSL